MSWVTLIWPMVASACLTLAAMHVLIWANRRTAWASLLFSLTAVATAAVAGCELWLMRTETTRAFGLILQWAHVPYWVLVISLVGFAPEAAPRFEDVIRRIHPDVRKAVQRDVRRRLETRGDYAGEYRVVWPDGTEHWLAARVAGPLSQAKLSPATCRHAAADDSSASSERPRPACSVPTGTGWPRRGHPRRRKRPVEVIDGQDDLPLRGGEAAELAQVRVPAALDPNPRQQRPVHRQPVRELQIGFTRRSPLGKLPISIDR